MKNLVWKSFVGAALLAFAALVPAAEPKAGTLAFTVSMPNPSNHVYHVVFRCAGLEGEAQDFKMPVWAPGYYVIQNFAQNVANFSATDINGKPFSWQKVSTNTWRVRSANSPYVVLSYDVKAPRSFVGTSYVDENRAYLLPVGVCMHLAGLIRHPVTLAIERNTNWNDIATGLDPVSKKDPYTLAAPDFDVLYDSPILMGNLTMFPPFQIRGVQHNFAAYNPGTGDYAQFMQDLKAVIEAGIAVTGEIPYNHYTFLAIGPGSGGGIEHLNSASVSFSGSSVNSRTRRNSQLDFLAHEYFHNYNVKRIRPIELGPFDYDHENRTHMLWVSEGLTSYYADLMLSRAGMFNQEETLDAFRRHIIAYENRPGHLYQSVAQASWDVWSQGQGTGGSRGSNNNVRINKTISYYDKGPGLGLLLDFKIRHETKNKKSLDTVMRTLYQDYFKKLKRGWTEDEFRAVCEKAAGTSLSEFFTYVYTAGPIDYGKYLAYAGLEVEKPKELPAAELGTIAESKDGKLVISAVEWGSAANLAKLAAQDEIITCDGNKVDVKGLTDAIAAKQPGDKVSLVIARDGKEKTVEVVLGHKLEKSFRISPIANPNPLQAQILKSWTTGS